MSSIRASCLLAIFKLVCVLLRFSMNAVLEFIAFEAFCARSLIAFLNAFGLGVLVEGVEGILEVEAGSSKANNGKS